jgi:hypothetical protein
MRNARRLFSGSRRCSKFIKKTSYLDEETSSDLMMEDKSTTDGWMYRCCCDGVEQTWHIVDAFPFSPVCSRAWGSAYAQFVGYHPILEPCPATSGSTWQGRVHQKRHIAIAPTQLV